MGINFHGGGFRGVFVATKIFFAFIWTPAPRDWLTGLEV